MDLPDPFRFIVAVWFAIVGGAMGSLLNVIVYRVPAGLSIFWPGSHCPHCKHGIRPYDNVPVLAWLWLRGRCRDCGQPISARYPLVEALTACLFLLLLDVEVFHEGTNLPLRIPVAVVHQSGYNEWQTFAICLLHLALLYTLLASALMTLDGNRPPWQLFVPAMVVGCVAPMFWPWLHPQASGPDVADSRWGGVIDSLLGLAAGYFLGRAARWLGPPLFRRAARLSGLGRDHADWRRARLACRGCSAVKRHDAGRTHAHRRASGTCAAGRRRLARVTAAVWLVPLALFWVLNWAAIAAVMPDH